MIQYTVPLFEEVINSWERLLAGGDAGPFKFAITELVNDYKAKKETWHFECNYNEEEICEKCPATKHGPLTFKHGAPRMASSTARCNSPKECSSGWSGPRRLKKESDAPSAFCGKEPRQDTNPRWLPQVPPQDVHAGDAAAEAEA